ncbi:hypothetical protein EJB05_56645, partial [Eragrostis curvula]
MATCDSASADVRGDEGRILLSIDRYWDRKEEFPNGHCKESPPIKIGGCSWRFCFYPNGASSSSSDYISIYLALDGRVARPVRARATFTLFDRAGKPVPDHSVDTGVREYSRVGFGFGCDEFARKDFLEASESERIPDGYVLIMCDVSVDRPAAPRFCLHDRFGLRQDVTLLVGGETFTAHRHVLAARSPAFVAEIFSGDSTAGDFIRVDGMSAQVFEAFLHFVYGDALPEMSEQEEPEMAEHLLAAADRFDMQELKLICEEILIGYIDENTAARMLELSVQHRCQMLKEACIEFLENHPALDAVMATDDGLVEHVANSCPALLKGLCADWFEDDESVQDDLVMGV